MVTGAPFATLNGVWVLDDRAGDEEVLRLLDDLPTTGLAYCLQAREDQRGRMVPVAGAHGMTEGPDIPMMVLTQPPDRECGQLVIRELTRDEFDARTTVAAAGFGVPEAELRSATEIFGRVPGYRMYVGEVDGRPVTTAVSIRTSDDSLGIFDVATRPDSRGHGYARTITIHALADGFDAGARWAWLQSSPEAKSLYEGLGFTTIENWSLWIREP